jgi:hypothetical protein
MNNLRPFTDAARYHVVGTTQKGPVNTAEVFSTGTQYTAMFGERTPESQAVYDDIGSFFAEGGAEVIVTRVPDLTAGTIASALTATGDTTRGAAVATPGVPAADSGPELLEHAQQFGKLALLHAPNDALPAEVAATAASLTGSPGSENAGIFWPWLTLRDRRQIAPTGYIAAVRARAHLTHGYWKHPAGPASLSRTAHGLRFPNTPASNEELSEQLISPIVTTRDGVELHGWWSLSGDRGNFPYLDTADMLNNLAADLGAAYSGVTRHGWDTVAKLRSQVGAITKGRLASLASAGAFQPKFTPAGTQADPGYLYSITTPDNQPDDRNVITVRVQVRPYTHANLIAVRVFRVPILEPFPQAVQL